MRAHCDFKAPKFKCVLRSCVGVPLWAASRGQRVSLVFAQFRTRVRNGTLNLVRVFCVHVCFEVHAVCRAVSTSAVVSFGRGRDFR